jgi:diacylglycerol kinase family enzyme
MVARPSGAAIPCLLNPDAGSARAAREVVAADGRFRLRECRPRELEDEVRAECRRGARRIAVAGGDGTIATAAGVLAGTATELAILPGGTLNHFARSHGIPLEPERACEIAAHAPALAVDVGYVNDRLFLNTSSVGMYVAFVRSRERHEPRLGYLLASVWAALRMLARLPIYSVDVEGTGERQSYRSPLVFVGVGERELRVPVFGERLPDGRSGLHTLVVRGRARARILTVLLAAAARGLRVAARTPHLDSFFGEQFTVDLPRTHAMVALDGETVRFALPLRYRLARGALRIAALPADE